MERLWPLTGRDQELAVIGASLRQDSRSRGVLLTGGPGVGKSRLAREALRIASRRGAVPHWASATASSRGIPLGALADVVDVDGPGSGDVVGTALDGLARSGRRLVLGVDDVHLLDDLSAVLVHRLVLRGVATVVLTLREGEPVPDAVDALWRDEHVRRLAVRPLGEAATAELLARALGDPVDGAGATRLWALTEGNVLFLRHLVDGELAAGRLRRVEGLWCWQPAGARIPPVLAEIVTGLMGRLAGEVRDVVDLLAVAEPVPLALLEELVSPEAVEDAESAGLVRVERVRSALEVRPAHPLYGEARRAALGTLRARRLRGLVAAGLPAHGEEQASDLLRRAVLTVDSDLPPDPALFLAASQQATRLLDLDLAERLARAAVDSGGGPEARLALASALSWLSRGEEADRIFADLVDAVPRGPLWEVAVAGRSGNLLWTLRRPDEAEAVLAGALADAGNRSRWALLHAFVAALDASRGRPRQALAGGARLLSPTPRDDLVALIAASATVAGAAVVGDLQQLREAAATGDAAGRRTALSIPRFGLGDFHVLGLRLAGEVLAARQVALRLQTDGRDVPGPAHLMGLVLRGHAELAAGRVRTAERCLREAWAGLGPTPHEFRFRCRTLLALSLALRGDPGARALVAELGGAGHPAYALLAPDDVLAQAWVEAADGATSRAAALAHEAAGLARSLDAPAFEVLALQTAVHAGDGTVAARLSDLAGVVGGPRASIAAAHARALADDSGEGLLAASEAWESVGDLVAAADAAAGAALAWAPRGRKASAAAASTRAHRIGRACEGACTPAMRAAARPLPLTRREREIASLAARGLSNRDIAARLVVSVRTVEGHLYRAGHKLGISDRTAFRALLGDGQFE